jgi:hypothetical protein
MPPFCPPTDFYRLAFVDFSRESNLLSYLSIQTALRLDRRFEDIYLAGLCLN